MFLRLASSRVNSACALRRLASAAAIFASASVTLDLQSYLQGEAAWQREKTVEAEQMLAFGNTALAKGNTKQARRAFQSAYGLSTHDNAFNEDARVQLHNLKLQQAIVGLNVRNSLVTGEADALTGVLVLLLCELAKVGRLSGVDASRPLISSPPA